VLVDSSLTRVGGTRKVALISVIISPHKQRLDADQERQFVRVFQPGLNVRAIFGLPSLEERAMIFQFAAFLAISTLRGLPLREFSDSGDGLSFCRHGLAGSAPLKKLVGVLILAMGLARLGRANCGRRETHGRRACRLAGAMATFPLVSPAKR